MPVFLLRINHAQEVGTPVWKPLYQGVSTSQILHTAPRPNRIQLLKIDLRAEGLSFLATPGNGEKQGETDGMKTTSFLKNYKLQAAINAAPYDPVPLFENGPEDISGLSISEGKIVSPFLEKEKSFPALILTKENAAKIAAPPFGDLKEAWNVVCGFNIVLKDKKVIPWDKVLHPRTAVGIGKQGTEMIWMVVDGRQPGVSEGATSEELGIWLKNLGCTDGINLDGGGTSTLAVEDGKGSAKILNTPIHMGVSGFERVSGSHLGIRAMPLPK